jgi:transcriptional regulator with XRE-family HTH domain
MKGADLKAFRKANNLTQEKLGEYLGIKKSFISTIESDKDPMPKDKLTKLLNNPHGWDVSMLQPSEVGEVLQMQEDGLVAELRAQIERLESKVDNLNQEIGEKNALIRLLREGVAKSV